jgi:beta-lactamase class A
VQLLGERLAFWGDAGHIKEMDDRLKQLERLSRKLADRPGEVAVLVQSKREPALSVTINAEKSIASASVIKAAIACTAVDQAARSNLDLTIPVQKHTLDNTFYCSILEAFDADDTLSLKALIGLMLIVSDNPATTAVLKAVGMDRVNAWCVANGLTATNLSVGFDDTSLGAPLRANLTTANDCLTLLQMIDREPNYAFIKHMLQNNLRNERIPKRLPDDALIAHKTGTLAGLVHDIAIVDSPIANYFVIILADGLKDDAAFARDLVAFSEALYGLMSRSKASNNY